MKALMVALASDWGVAFIVTWDYDLSDAELKKVQQFMIKGDTPTMGQRSVRTKTQQGYSVTKMLENA